MNILSERQIEDLRNEYPRGTVVKLVHMDDKQAPPRGTFGIVNFIDDIGTIHINWETGSSLGVCIGEDEIVKV